MALLKTTISFQTNTLFPNPVNLTIPVNETVDLDAAFNTIKVEPNSNTAVYTVSGQVGTTGVTYLFIQADSANDPTNDLTIVFQNSTDSVEFAKLLPGDFLWIPLNTMDAFTNIYIDNASTFEKTFYYIFAERG
jgi:hypothetical protein